ncbi:hypothetical protein AALP_AA7G104100 [Arabis alpina]|uniref:Uncharacterized protein n=1 Tax=Arabis alpina TaxID=50452 RepID=A0A087GH62_ARAAL|nr:hypothetical protein AALP_AA7G104100 [Arabis alpina]
MSSDSSASVKLDRKRVRIDPNVTLARAPEHTFDASIPTGVPLVGLLDRGSSDASSPEMELPTHRPEASPPRETGPSAPRPALKDSTEEGSSYANPETISKGSEPSDRVETDDGTSGGDKGSLINFRNAEPKSPGPGLGHGIRLDDSNDVESTMHSSLIYALNPAGGWEVEPVKKKTPKDSVITLLQKNKDHIHHWPDFLSFQIARNYPRFSSGDFYIPLEDNSSDLPPDSNKKNSSSQKRKSSTPAKKKTKPAQTRPKESPMVKLNLDVVDSDEELELPRADRPAEREGLRPEKAPITLGRGKGMMGGLLSDSRRAEEARLEKERQKEESRRKLRDEEKKKKAEEAEVRMTKRVGEKGDKDKPSLEKKRSAKEALGSGNRVEKVARFNTTGLPVELDHMYTGAIVRAGDAEEQSSSPHDFVFDFRGGLNTQNSELVSESNRPKEARCKAEREAVKFKDLLDHSQQVNNNLIVERDVLISKVGALTSVLAEADEVKKGEVSRIEGEVSRIEGEVAELKSASKDAVARAVGEAKKRAKDKLWRSLEIMEERSRAQTEVDRLASLASQVVGVIRRMDKAAKEGVPTDAANKEKLEARLAAYTAEADQIVLPPIPEDSSDDEGVEPTRGLALDISSAESSEDEAERAEIDGRMTVAGKTHALTRAEIEEAVNGDTHDGMNQFELQGGDVEDVIEHAGTEELVVTETVDATTEAVDAATGEPIASLFSLPDPNPDEQPAFP